MKKILLITISSILFVSYNSTARSNVTKVNSSDSYASALAAAKTEQKKVRKVGFEWNTIKKLMRSASTAHKAGNNAKAIKQLETARTHAILGQEQARTQRNAGPRF